MNRLDNQRRLGESFSGRFNARRGRFTIPVVRAEDMSRPPSGWKPNGDAFVLLSDRYGVRSGHCEVCGCERIVILPQGTGCRRAGHQQ